MRMDSNKASWLEEKQSASLYAVLAEVEKNHALKNLFSELGKTAEDQAKHWEKLGSPEKTWNYSPDIRTKIVACLIRRMGARHLRGVLAAMKIRGLSALSSSDPEFLFHRMPHTVEEVGARHRKGSTAGNLRAAVFGINDGLISNASLIFGVVGAQVDHHTLMITGIAGGLAGAFSMAAGEFVSVKSQREMIEHQINLERHELETYPNEEAAELALIYQARGMPLDRASELARKNVSNIEEGLAVLTREELGVDPTDLNSPWEAGLFSFVSFVIGSSVPLLPFLLSPLSSRSLYWSLAATGLALFLVGSTISLFTGRRAFWSGLRMVLIGGGAGILTYFIGKLIGGK